MVVPRRFRHYSKDVLARGQGDWVDIERRPAVRAPISSAGNVNRAGHVRAVNLGVEPAIGDLAEHPEAEGVVSRRRDIDRVLEPFVGLVPANRVPIVRNAADRFDIDVLATSVRRITSVERGCVGVRNARPAGVEVFSFDLARDVVRTVERIL